MRIETSNDPQHSHKGVCVYVYLINYHEQIGHKPRPYVLYLTDGVVDSAQCTSELTSL